MSTTKPRRGRPPLAWLRPEQVDELVANAAVVIELHGRHVARTVGRIVARHDTSVLVRTQVGEVTVLRSSIKRLRPIGGLFEPGDPVLLRNVDEDVWRGGVVRTQGQDVLVETIGGGFEWHPERDLEPPEARDEPLPTLTRGPVPARR